MEYKPPSTPPASVRVLESAVDAYAKAYGLAPGRVRRWISFTVLGGVLERVHAYDGTPKFLVKGGVAIERRLGARTRATKDFDTIYRDSEAELLDELDKAFREPYEGWTLRRDGEVEDLGKARRVMIRLEYRNRPWGTVPLEVSGPEGSAIPHETVPAVNLGDFGLQGPTSLPCLPLRRQVAQKLHGLTAPRADSRENPRFRDLFDVWLLRDVVPVDRELRAECKQIFRLRNDHPWPPTVVVYPSWPESLKKLATEEGITFPEAASAADDVMGFIRQIDDLSLRVFANEYREIATVLEENTNLRDAVYALVQAQAVSGKVTEGLDRLSRFREIMERLVSGEVDLSEAIQRTEQYVGSADSPHAGNARVFPRGWAERLVRTQYSRFYNQAVIEMLIAEGHRSCFVPHSSAEDAGSPCSAELGGKEHDLRLLHSRLVSSYADGQWTDELKIPNHPHCTHVVAPVAVA